MNKKEVLEIRKQFTPANCKISRICGCYVDDKNIKLNQKKLFSPFRKKPSNISTFSRNHCQEVLVRI